MGVVSGVLTAIKGIPTVSRWEVSWREESPTTVSSATQGASQPGCGILDWEGSILCYGHTPAYLPGDTLTLQASIDGTKGVSGNAVVQSVRVIGNVARQQAIMLAYSIVGNGGLSFGNVAVTDTTPPVKTCPVHPVLLDAMQIDDVSFWQIVLHQAMPTYVSTATEGKRKRLPGVFQAWVQWRQLLTDSAPPAVGTEHSLDIIITPKQGSGSAKAWSFDAIRIVSVNEYGVDLHQAADTIVPEYEVTAQFQPLVEGVQQTIVDPSDRQIWPKT